MQQPARAAQAEYAPGSDLANFRTCRRPSACSNVMCWMLPRQGPRLAITGLQQTSATGAELKVGLEVRSITSVTLSAGRSPGERALTRRSARQTVAEQALQHSRQNGSYASWGAAGTTALIGLGCPGAVPAITVVQPGTI